MESLLEQFRSVTCDSLISNTEVLKYLKWGKGNIEQAIAYYYQKKDKEQRLGMMKEFRQLYGQEQKKQKEQEQKNVFEVMKKGSVQLQKTDAAIEHYRKEYELPVRSRLRSGQQAGKEKLEEQLIDEEFQDADYLPAVFDMPFTEVKEEEHMLEKLSRKDKDTRKSQNISSKNQKQTYAIFCLKNESKNDSKDSINEYQGQPRFSQNFDQQQILLGNYISNAHATFNIALPNCFEGSPIHYQVYYQQPKGHFGKKAPVVNIRLKVEQKVFGRVDDREAQILVPLIHHQMIRVELTALNVPRKLETFKKITLRASVYLLRKAITEPVVETFEGKSQAVVERYSAVARQIIELFDQLLVLPIASHALIKKLSKKRKGKRLESKYKQDTGIGMIETAQKDNLSKQKQLSLFSISQKLHEQAKFSTQSLPIVGKVFQQVIRNQQTFYQQLIDLNEQDYEPYQPPKQFRSQLYNYQALALSWMLKREGFLHDNANQAQDLHPLWTEYHIEGYQHNLFVNELTSQISVRPPLSVSRCRGGILADQMGLGKTVMMAALMVTNHAQKQHTTCGGTLVIVPLTLLSQWQSQLKQHTNNLKVIIYYSDGRDKLANQLGMYDVIITTYGTVSHEYSKGWHVSQRGVYRYKWQRIVLDEAHYIKGRIIQTAKATYELRGQCRWCLTGTPIQNNLTELFALVHFIRYSPWSQYACWNKYINVPHQLGDENVNEVIRTILRKIFLRRTKTSKDSHGNNIIDLPNRISQIEILNMSEQERNFYDSVYANNRVAFDELQRLGILQSRYMQVLQMLTRLRQVCSHPILFKSVSHFTKDNNKFQTELKKFIQKRQKIMIESSISQQTYFQPMLDGQQQFRVEVGINKINQQYLIEVCESIKKQQLNNCIVCIDELQDPVITPCLHIFCKICLIRQIEQSGNCPVCRRTITKQDYIYLPRQNRFNVKMEENQLFKSAKLVALNQHLSRMIPEDKAVVFSQFLGMLDLMEHNLKCLGISYVVIVRIMQRMQGSTTQKQRDKIVHRFQNDPTVKVFIVSLKTAGVGLNLVAANKVFLMDPWWNPGVEDQAIERVHRIGQKREVCITRFIVDKSIELRMLELNTGKKQLSNAVLNSQPSIEKQTRFQRLKYLMQRY